MSLLFNMLSRFVIAFLPRSKGLLISWLQSTSAVILGLEKIKSVKDQIVDIFVFGGHTVCAAVTQLGHPMKNKGTVDNMWRNEDGSVPIKLHWQRVDGQLRWLGISYTYMKCLNNNLYWAYFIFGKNTDYYTPSVCVCTRTCTVITWKWFYVWETRNLPTLVVGLRVWEWPNWSTC